nr:MAG TPA: hypothetical protein [Caudoviricetes sp.]
MANKTNLNLTQERRFVNRGNFDVRLEQYGLDIVKHENN